MSPSRVAPAGNGTAPPRIDVCLVATRRPELLEETLASFHENLFRHFEIGRIIANIDPAFGSLADQDACVDLVRHYDPEALISLPETPGFATAVAANWEKSRADILLHLEDDWRLSRPVLPDVVRLFAERPDIGQISFNHADKAWNRRKKGEDCYIRRRRSMFGLKVSMGRKIPVFLTAPSFYRGSFARGAAALMDPDFDPEKQFCRGVNPRLEAYAAPFRNRILGDAGAYYIQDLGRDWRRGRGIEKEVVGGQSYWSDPSVPAK